MIFNIIAILLSCVALAATTGAIGYLLGYREGVKVADG